MKRSNMKNFKICLVILCLLHISAVGSPQSAGANHFMEHSTPEYKLKWKRKDRKTRRGVISDMYHHFLFRAKIHPHKKVFFSYLDFYNWCLSQESFERIYNEWVSSGFIRNIRPSCDRINSDGPYSFDNIRIVTLHDNIKKGHERGVRRIPVIVHKYGTNEFIGEFISLSEAVKCLKIYQGSASRVLNNTRNHCGGYVIKRKSSI